MIRRALLVACAAIALAACSRREAPAEPVTMGSSKLPKDTANEQQNLADISRGASIVSRTGEWLLQWSALLAIDGDITTSWQSPFGDLPQSIVVGLAARSRIDRVGIRSLRREAPANHVTFEGSLDGRTWQPLASIDAKVMNEAQWANVTPAEVSYLRLTIVDAQKKGADVRIHSILAHGAEVAPPHGAMLDGCWSVGGSSGSFARSGTRVIGRVEVPQVSSTPLPPFILAGGYDGRIWRFEWVRGNDYGYALATVAPDGQHMSAEVWHEEPIPLFVGPAWFGDRAQCTAAALDDELPLRYLRRTGRLSLFALQFDAAGTLDAPRSAEELALLARIIGASHRGVRIVARELRQPDAVRAKQITEREIATLRDALTGRHADLARVTFVAAGNQPRKERPETDAARAMLSAVDVELLR